MSVDRGWYWATGADKYVLTETRLLPAKTQRLIEFLREQLQDAWG